MQAGLIACHGVALLRHGALFFGHCGGISIGGEIEIHGHFGRGLAVAVLQHALIQRQIARDAGHVVVLMAGRAGDDPRQTDGIEERNGGYAFASLTERVL